MMTMSSHIADYLAEQTPDHEGDICVAFTSEQRDQLVIALRVREAVEPFIAFAQNKAFALFPDETPMTRGSPMAHRQLTAGHFRALLAAAGRQENN